jgi:hypothetical protein
MMTNPRFQSCPSLANINIIIYWIKKTQKMGHNGNLMHLISLNPNGTKLKYVMHFCF